MSDREKIQMQKHRILNYSPPTRTLNVKSEQVTIESTTEGHCGRDNRRGRNLQTSNSFHRTLMPVAPQKLSADRRDLIYKASRNAHAQRVRSLNSHHYNQQTSSRLTKNSLQKNRPGG